MRAGLFSFLCLEKILTQRNNFANFLAKLSGRPRYSPNPIEKDIYCVNLLHTWEIGSIAVRPFYFDFSFFSRRWVLSSKLIKTLRVEHVQLIYSKADRIINSVNYPKNEMLSSSSAPIHKPVYTLQETTKFDKNRTHWLF